MKSYKQLLLANKAWSMELQEENPDFFIRQLQGQKPEFLWIGCSDSRVNPEQMTMTPPGGMFIHRNIANLVNAEDLNLMSVLQYAVTVLQVKHIIVCGHHGCGGIMAAYDGQVDGAVDTWLENPRQVHRDHADEIAGAGDRDACVNRFVEVNVRDQLIRLVRTKTVQDAFAAGQPLALHGWVYDMRDGLIKPLMEIDASTPIEEIGQPERVLV